MFSIRVLVHVAASVTPTFSLYFNSFCSMTLISWSTINWIQFWPGTCNKTWHLHSETEVWADLYGLCCVVFSVVKPQMTCLETPPNLIDLDLFLQALRVEPLATQTEWDGERQTVGGLVKIHFVGCDKWDIPCCIKLPCDTLLGSYPESLCCGPVCWSRPCDSQITTTIKHFKTELALDCSQLGAASQLHSSQLQRGTRPKVWQPGKPVTVLWNMEA